MKYLILSILAYVLFVSIYPLAVLYSAGASLIKWNGKIIKRTLYATAFGLDQAGNSGFSDLFNDVLVRSRRVYPFGSPDKTISHTLGRNKYDHNLTALGRFLRFVLNAIDKDHTEKAAINPQYKDEFLPEELK